MKSVHPIGESVGINGFIEYKLINGRESPDHLKIIILVKPVVVTADFEFFGR